MKKKSDKTHKNNTGAQDNINRRERIEEKLRYEEQRFRAFVENSSDIIALINLEGIITYINPAVEKVLGFKPEERIGAKGFELIHPDDMKVLADSFNTLARNTNAPVIQGEMHLRHKDGSWRTLEAVGSNLVNNNVVEAVIVNYRDITERKRAEELLRKASNEWQETFDAVSDAICILDFDQRIMLCNRAMNEMFGLTQEKLIGRHCWEIVHDTQEPIPDCLITRIKNSLHREEMELQRDGKSLNIVAYPLLDENRTIRGVVHIVHDITDRKNAEKKLLENERQYRLLTEKMSDIVWIADMNLQTTYVSPSIKNVLGFSQEERMRQTLNEQLTPHSLSLVMEALTRELALEEQGNDDPNRTLKIELEYYHKDGSTRWMELVISGLRNDQGVLASIHGVSRDITERKKSEEVLRQSEEKYRAILENIEEGYFEIDLAGNFTFFNDTVCRVTGYSREELMGMNNRQYTDKEEFNKVFLAYNKVYNTGKPNREFGQQIIRKDGIKRYIEGSISLLKDSSGKPIGFRGIARDITERKNAESKSAAMLEALRKSEESYTRLVDTIHDIILSTDLTGNILFVNDHALKLGGYSREEMESHNILKFISPEDHEKVIKNLTHIMDSRPGPGEYSLLTKDGRKIPFEVNGDVLRNENGTPFGVVIVCRDITERKLAEEKLRLSEEKFRNIFMTSPNCIAITRLKDGLFIDVNKAYEDVVGWKREAVIGTTSTDPRHNFWVDLSARKIMVADLKADRNILNREFEFWRSDGSVRKGIYSARSIDIDEEECLIFILQDITERKQMEERLLNDQQELHAIMDASPICISWSDQQGNIRYANRKFQETFGYTVEDIPNIDTWLLKAFPSPSYREHVLSLINLFIEALAQGKEATPAELNVVCKNGSIRNVLQTMLFTSNRILVIYYDITEQKQRDEELRRTLDSLRKAFGTTIQVMVSAVEMRDPYTSGHQIRSADLARAIATEMGLPQDKIDGIRMAGIIHDVGKLSIPAEILSKPTKLTEIEFSLIQEHSESGYEMLKHVESPWPLAEIVHQHHERIDGSGYPRNLKGDEILIEARILAVADVVEAMASHRPHRPTLGIEAALGEIEKNKGILYDNDVVDTCLKLFREKGYQLNEVEKPIP